MDWGHLFFKFSGRINRAKFWIAALVYGVISIILAVLSYVDAIRAGPFRPSAASSTSWSFISGFAVGVKRLHDRDKSGWYLLLFYLVPAVLIGSRLRASLTMEDSTMIAGILWPGRHSPSCVWAFVELGCLRGTIGANRFGPDPLMPAAMPPPVRMPA